MNQAFGAIARYEVGRYQEAIDILETLFVPWAGMGVTTIKALCLIESGGKRSASKLLADIQTTDYVFDEGLVLAALGKYEAAKEAYEKTIFNGQDFATSYWPSVGVRYLFKRVWDSMPDNRCYDAMLEKVNAFFS